MIMAASLYMSLALENDVRRVLRCFVLRAAVAEGSQVEVREQVLAPAEHDRRDGDVHLVDEARLEVLADRAHAAADAHVLAAGRLARQIERLLNAAGDEVERRVAFHR